MRASPARIELNLAASRQLAAVAAGAGALALVSGAMLAPAPMAVTWIAALWALRRLWRGQIRRTSPDAVTRLVLEPGQSVRVELRGRSEPLPAAWRAAPHAIGGFVVLPLRAAGRRADVLVAPDMLDAAVYRQLRTAITTGVLMPPADPESSGRPRAGRRENPG